MTTTTGPLADLPSTASVMLVPPTGMPVNVAAGIGATEPFYLIGGALQPPASIRPIATEAEAVAEVVAKAKVSEANARAILDGLVYVAELGRSSRPTPATAATATATEGNRK